MNTVLTEEVGDGITVVTLNRPETLNSMTVELVRDLHGLCDTIAADARCRVVILTGAGRGFCSGHDLEGFGAVGQGSSIPKDLQHQEMYAGLIARVNTLPQAVIAAVNGPAAGGGLALALAADTRVCSESARFNAAFIRLGVSGCDVGVSYLLPRIVGPTLAFEMMLSGRLIDAEEAKRTGLVLDVVPDGEVLAAAVSIAHRVIANAPFAVRMTKQVMWRNLDAPSLAAAIELENRTQILCAQTRDMRESVAAFVERRPAAFTNS